MSNGSPTRGVALVATLLILSVTPSTAAATGPSTEPGWIAVCDFSHRLHDDPIVHRRMPGMSHSHDFYGNRRTDASSTRRSLAGAGTTCDVRGDTAAYWAPTAYLNGHALLPQEVRFYYRTNTRPLRAIRAFPPGLRVVAGKPHASHPTSTSVVSWNCGHDDDQRHPSACGRRKLQAAHVKFPDCWDGVHLDSPDHRRHMKYSDDGGCPRSHPVPVPRLIMRITWPIHDGRGIRFSSGAFSTYHADFFNTWKREALHRLMHDCIHRGIDCGHVDRDPVPVATTGNLVDNSGFESGLGGWSAHRSRLDRVSGGMRSRRAVLVTARAGGTRCGLHDRPGWVRSTRSGRYRASSWVRSGNPQILRLRLRERSSGRALGAETAWVRVTDRWRKVFVDYVTQRPGRSKLSLSMWTPSPRAGHTCFRADDVTVKRAKIE